MDIIKDAQERYKRAKGHWQSIYDKALDDLRFLSDDQYSQWDMAQYNARISTGRPAITIPILGQFIHQVANDIRMNTPTINVIPSDGASDDATAEVYKGLIKNIEYISNADDAYDTAALSAIKCGIGFIRVDHDYVNNEGFEQDLIIRRVNNPLAVFLDPESGDADGRDAKYATIIDRMLTTDFKRKYPKFDPVSFQDTRNLKKDDEFMYIAEDFFLEESEQDMMLLDTGEIVPYEKGVEFRSRRKMKKVRVKRTKLSGADILEETYFPGSYIPIIPVYGEEEWIEGKRNLKSLIRNSKDAQRLYNFWRSSEAELLMKQPKARFLAAEGQTEDYAADYLNPDKAMVLRYKVRDAEGNPVGRPEVLPPPPSPAGFITAARESAEDVKMTMGLYNASLGQRSNEQSGRAINARKLEGDVATYHFGDNLVRSITQVGRVLVNACPEIYDTPRIIRIIGNEGEPKQVGINGTIVEGQPETIDLTKGKYDIRVVTGAPFTTKRQEASELFRSIIEKRPELMSVMGDLLFKYSDVSGAEILHERMKKVVDPKFLEDEEQEGPSPEVQQMQMALEQTQQALQAIQAQIEQKDEAYEIEKAKMELKQQYDALKSEEQISLLKKQILEKDIELQVTKLQAPMVVQTQSEAI